MKKHITHLLLAAATILLVSGFESCSTGTHVKALACEQFVDVNRISNNARKERMHAYKKATKKRFKKLHVK